MLLTNNEVNDTEYKIKISFLGYSGVGKTSIIEKYFYNEFKYNIKSTIGLSYEFKNIQFDGKNIQVIISDTAGQERFNSIPKTHYRDIDAFIIVYDVTDQISFETIELWISEIDNNTPTNKKNIIFIVGNKTDINPECRSFSYDEAKSKIDNIINEKMPYIEVSAKNGENIETLMNIVITKCLTDKKYIKVIKNDYKKIENTGKKCC